MDVSRFNPIRRLHEHLQRRALSVPDLPGRFYRGLLISGAIVVSLAVLAASAAGTMLLVKQFLDERERVFIAQQNVVKANLNRYETLSRQAVETFEMLRRLEDKDQVPVERYRGLLAQQQGVLLTDADLTLTPMTVFSSLTLPEDHRQLSTLLQLAREISPSPLLRQRETGYYLGGFIYSPDRRFLATWPSLSESRLANARIQGTDHFIESTISQVEAAMSEIPPHLLLEQRFVWISLYRSPITDELVTLYALPVYRADQRIAVMVIRIPFDKFPLLFQDTNHELGFFVASSDRRIFLGADDPREREWADWAHDSTDLIEQAARRPGLHRSGGMFFLAELIPGPNWLAVYAFDWYSVMLALRNKLILGALLTVTVLSVLWAFVILLDRIVLVPIRRNARQVYESEAFNRAVLTTAPVGLTVYDPSTDSIVMQNEATQGLLASSPEGTGLYRRLLAGRPWTRLGDPHDAITESNEVRFVETSVVDSEGQRREISVAFSQARYQQREVVLFGLTDISDQKTTVRLLQRAREAAEQANQAKSAFLAMMSHEIRTPLHGALGNLELLAMDQLTPNQKTRVSTIRRAFDALLALINDILDLSKMEAQELQLHAEPFQLDELIERCAQTFAPVILDKRLRLLCLIDPHLAGTWNADSHRLSQVLMNLLSNSRKFTETGSITLRAVPGETRDGVTWVRLSVSDTGIGIAPTRLERIFEPFVQADRTITSRYGGTGLGLTLCHRIITLMGGQMSVDSEEGEGSIFTVNVPLKRENNAHESSPRLERYEFTDIVLLCDSLLWQMTLVAQLRLWLPQIRLVEAEGDNAVPAPSERTVLLFATFGQSIPPAWQAVRSGYVDTLILCADGPLYPERRDKVLYATSLSASMFQLALAACGGHDDMLAQTTGPSPIEAVQHCTTRVLIAEDDPLNRTLLEHQLEALGYGQVDSVGDGMEALKHCLANTYDVVVTDMGMPVMGGRAFLTALRARGIHTPVIVSTADTGTQGTGFADVLHKPITIERLGTALEQVLGTAPPSSQEAPSSLGLKQMRSLFLSGWDRDEAALREAWKADNSERFLRQLHRLKGALLVLGEQSTVASSDRLKRQVENQGMGASEEEVDAFMKQMERLVDAYGQEAG